LLCLFFNLQEKIKKNSIDCPLPNFFPAIFFSLKLNFLAADFFFPRVVFPPKFKKFE